MGADFTPVPLFCVFLLFYLFLKGTYSALIFHYVCVTLLEERR